MKGLPGLALVALAACSSSQSSHPGNSTTTAPSPPASDDASAAATDFVAIPSLGVEVRMSPKARVDGNGSTAIITDTTAQLRIEADQLQEFENVVQKLSTGAKEYELEIQRKEKTSDGWIVAFTTRWPGAKPVGNLWQHRRVGTLELECRIATPDLAGVARAKAWCESLRPLSGGTVNQKLPDGEPVIRMRIAGGFSGRMRAGLDLFADGTVIFHGPRCESWRGPSRKIDAAAVDTLLQSFEEAQFQDLPPWIQGACADDIFTNLERRTDAGWKSTSYGGCSRPPTGLVDLVAQTRRITDPNPCSE
jgi:hypothetical protein